MGELVKEFLNVLKGIDALKFVTVWNNQFQYMEDGSSYTFPMPCAFLEVNTESASQLHGGYLAMDVILTIHIGQDVLNGENMDENLTIFDLRDAVVKAFTKSKQNYNGSISLTGERQDFDHSNIYHYQLDFKATFIDQVSVPDQYFINPVTLQINK